MKSFRSIYLTTVFVFLSTQLLANVTGTIKFRDSNGNRVDNYKVGPVYLEVVDKDRDTDGSLADTLSVYVKSSTESVWERVVLKETSINSGVFVGSIGVDSAGVALSDGKLQVRVGDDLYGEYRDLKNDFGNPQLISGRSLYGFSEIPGATYSANTTWTKANSPYLVTGDVRVINGATLTVHPGVEARFLANTDKANGGNNNTLSELRLEGSHLTAVGTVADSIKFTLQSSNPQQGQWQGIMGYNGCRITLEYVKVNYAGTAVNFISSPGQSSIKKCFIYDNSTGIYIDGYSLTNIKVEGNKVEKFGTGISINGADTLVAIISNEIIGTSTWSSGININGATPKIESNIISAVNNGIYLDRSSNGLQSPTVTRNTIKNSNRGILITGNMQPIINYNNLADNFNYGIGNNTQYEIDARYNWWGTDVTAQMNTGGNPKNIGYIYDKFDENGRGMVNYAGWLDSEFSSILSTPVLLTPANSQQINTLPISFKWKKVKDATTYTIQLSLNNTFSTVVYIDSTITDTTKQIGGLQYFKEYFWRVKATSPKAKSGWSEVWRFTTGPKSETAWTSNLKLTDNGNNTIEIVFGQHPDATEGIDNSLGEYELPPVPPAGIIDARFSIPNSFTSTIMDFRPSTQSVAEWRLSFQPSTSGYPITFSWDSSQLPKGTFAIMDEITGTIININMKESSSYILTNTGITSLKIKYLETVTKQIVLKSGWNMISSPVDKSNLNVAQLFPNSQSNLFGFNAGYKIDTSMVVTKGYWIKNSMDEIINVIGEQISGGINVKQGWNMIGIYDKNVSVQDLTTSPASIIQSDFFGFSGGYVIADSLKSGKGYWIKASSNGQIELNTVLGKKNTNRLARTIDEEWVSVTVRDRNGKTKTVYIDKKQEAGEGYQLPPLPPNEIMDVRFIDQSYVANGGKENQIAINGAEYPIEIIVNGSDVKIGDALGMNGFSQILRAGEKLQITNEMINRIKITELEIPLNFELSQNYPNPFNPATKIRFSLPENGRTKLTIYNSLGEKVETLVDEIKEAGYHEVEWNAKKYSSGVYFYEITNRDKHLVKKMQLVK